MTDRQALIMLNMVEGLGPKRLTVLLSRVERPSAAFRLNKATLASIVGERLALQIVQKRGSADFFEELRLLEKEEIETVTILDSDYPLLLKEIYDPPSVLYVKGRKEYLRQICFAVVGSRRASSYGLRSAEEFASKLAQRGLVIVSGLARGIDTCAHRAALKQGKPTVAVLGSGLLTIYPPENRPLSREIAASGCLISEFPLRTTPLRENFPRRNRIISGLSRGVLVVEAGQRSGALITARFALDQGRDIFCLPGAIDSEQSRGSNGLIKQGACLVDRPDDIMEGLGLELIRT